MELTQIKSAVCAAEDAIAQKAEEISTFIFNHPELGGNEYISSKYLTDELAKQGFSVEMPYCGIDTAFRCEYGDDNGPKIAFLAEYDALPGYENSPSGNGVAHACGHNWISASTYAAAVSLKALKSEFGGKIILIGTPAEENLGAKVDMAREGCFDDIDAVFQFHLANKNCIDPAALAMCDFYYTFTGKASHASANPEDGINALDACNLTFAGINALRQHVRPDTRLHGIIIEGGNACNIVPDKCVMQYYVRAGQKDYLEDVIDRVNNCARGAALMTGCGLEIVRAKNTYYDIKQNQELRELMKVNLENLGVTDFMPANLMKSGSTDIGNVSYACPTCYCTLDTTQFSDAVTHDKAFLDVADSDFAHKLIHVAAKAMAMTALDVYCSTK